MATISKSKHLLKYASIFLILVLGTSLLLGNSNVCTAAGILLIAVAMLYLRQQEVVSEKEVARRIKAEFPTESQSHILEVYEHMKIKEMEGLFQKILDDAKGDVAKVERLASVAESVGWKAFLESHW